MQVTVEWLSLLSFIFTLSDIRQGLVSYSFLLSFFLKLGGFRLTYFFLKLGGFRLTYFFLAISLPCRSIRQGIVSYSFLSSSSGNTSKTYSFDMPGPISTKLGHKNPWPMAFMSYDQNGVKGHVGVTGVKKVKNSKTLLLLQITGYDHVTHVYASAWPLLQKLSL